MVGREILRLRDEKIALVDTKTVFYCLYFQAIDDQVITDGRVPNIQPGQSKALDLPSWLVPKSPPRSRSEVLHPAKFPESLIDQFVDLCTHKGDKIIDPMVGTGTAVISAIRKNRVGYGVELSKQFSDIAKTRVANEETFWTQSNVPGFVYQGDASKLESISELNDIVFDYMITSPPYWNMLKNPGSENQRNRRQKGLSLVYSDEERDLGNIDDYNEFLDELTDVYSNIADRIRTGGMATIIVKNVKRHHVVYPIAWDLTQRLIETGKYRYNGTTFWCQDDIGLKPFAVGIYWVSNTLHHYCLHFERTAK